MAYTLKTREEFNEYLKKVEVIPSGDEMLIDEFNSSSLFDLYNLLTKIKNDRQISPTRQSKLRRILRANFPKEIASFLHFPITNETLHSLEEHIKDVFLAYIENPKTSSITEKEMENLKIIVAKKYPTEIQRLIKKEKDSIEFKLEKAFIEKTFYDVIDEYTKHTENVQNNEDVQTAYYTQSKNIATKVHIATTGRQKAPKSVTDNIRKEFMKSLESVVPSNLEKGITYADLTSNFNLYKVSDDYSGYTVYVTDIDDTFHIDAETKKTEKGQEFIKYRKEKEDNVPFYHSLYDFLYDTTSFLDFTEEDYLQMRIELLDRLQHLTYPKCSEEYNGILFKPKDKNDPRNLFF